MDINNTKFHLLNGRDDWESQIVRQELRDLWWDHQQSYVTLLPKVLQYPSAGGEILQAADRRGAARDRYGNFFWIADIEGEGDAPGTTKTIASQQIRILPACEQGSGTFWSLADLAGTPATGGESDFSPLPHVSVAAIASLRGLAITRENYMVVGTLNPGGLLIFDLHAGGPPLILRWPEGVNFQPFDIAPAFDGGVWILDRNGDPAGGRLWRLDRHMRVCDFAGNAVADGGEMDFTPVTPPPEDAPECTPVSDVTADWALTLPEQNPLALIGLEDDSVLILCDAENPAFSAVARYAGGERTDFFELHDDVLSEVFPDAAVKCHDFAFISHAPSIQYRLSGELSLVLNSGDQALAFFLSVGDEGMEMILQPRFIPLRRFGGKALVSGEAAVYYDIGEQWFPLTGQPRRRYVETASMHLQFDGKEAGCVWHRIVMDACIPNGTRVIIASRAADELTDLPHADWHLEAAPYRRATGNEIPFLESAGVESNSRINDPGNGTGTWEWLFHHARGRYVELGITLSGDTRLTPKIRALRVYYPRFSWLNRFLPAIYREQGEYSEFLDRYLANVEGILTGVESEIASAQLLFDTRTAPDEYLDWLAAWLGGVIDSGWDSRRKRLFIDHAELLFRWRGTRIGMRAALRLATDECPDASIFQELIDQRHYNPIGVGGDMIRIVERFSVRRLPGVVIDNGQNTGGLSVAKVSENLSELGDRYHLSQRYREYLYWKYSTVENESTPLERLNLKWESAYASFYDIEFSPERPQQSGELSDWSQFVRRELAR
ncbi:MAG TPA: phage tail protein, partial [Gammaproteobacteria bacterium]